MNPRSGQTVTSDHAHLDPFVDIALTEFADALERLARPDRSDAAADAPH